ncbi:MAG: DUF2341 domain-containing protein, partial [Patescibacteria group bacterium]
MIYIKRDKSCKKIYSNWYIKSIAISAPIKIKSRRQWTGTPTEASEKSKREINIDWKEKYFDLLKKFRQQCFKFGTTRAVAVFLCIALIITAGWQMIWSASRAAAEISWGFTSATDYTAGDYVEVDAANNNIARLKQNYTPGTNWIATNGNGYDWTYRQEVSVNNSSVEYDFSNYQLKLTLNSDNFNFSIPDSSGSDIRFTGSLARTSYATEQERLNAQGSHEISYYKESYNQANKTAVFWVKLPSIYSFWGVSTEDSGTDKKVKVDDVSGFPDPADFPNGEIPVTVRDTSNTETNYITAIDGDTKELTFKNNFAVSYLTSKTAQVRYAEDEQIYLYYGNSDATVSTQTTMANMFGETNLQALWKFDEGTGGTTKDYSGNGHTCTITGATWTSAGKFGNALRFDGINDSLNCGSTSLGLVDSGALSIEAWLYLNYNANATIIERDPVNSRWMMYMPGSSKFLLRGNNTSHDLTSNTQSNGEWLHVVGIFNNTSGNIYVNGQNVASGEVDPITDTLTNLYIGAYGGSGDPFSGVMNEMIIYNKVLTTDEIISDYNFGFISVSYQTAQYLYPTVWSYQRAITVNNTGNSNTLANYQIKISDLNTQSLISANKIQIDCSDIRFTDSDGSTELNYWIEPNTCNTTATIIWVKIPSISASSTKTIYMYYGNTGVSINSDITDTFIRVIDGIEGSWDFEEGSGGTTADSSGNGNTGTISGATWTSNGKFGNALSFDGTTNSIDLGSSSTLKPPSVITISFWKKEAVLNNELGIFGNISWGYPWIGLWESNGYYFNINSTYSGTSHFLATRSTNWQHIVAACDGSSQTFYVDGSQVLDQPSSTVYSYSSNPIMGVGYGSGYNGLFDKVQIYNHALNQDEVTDLYNNYGYTTANYPRKTLIRKYSFPEPTTTVNSETATAWPSSEVAKLTVVNNTGQNYATLSSFTETLTGDNAGSVKYQISNNGTNWYWYNSGTGDWEAASSLLQTNTASDVN